jgi:hypothetical protein
MAPKITAELGINAKPFHDGLKEADKHKSDFGHSFQAMGHALGHGFKEVGKNVGAALMGGLFGALKGGAGAGEAAGGGAGGAVGAALGMFAGPQGAIVGALIGERIGGAIGGAVGEGLRAGLKLENAQDDLDTVLRNRLHKTYQMVKGDVEEVAEKMHSVGFGTADSIAAIGQLVVSHMSLEQAEKNLALAADVAAKRHVNLADGAKLVGLASMGNLRGLREFGISLKSTGDRAQDAKMAMKELAQFTGAAQKQAERDPFRVMRIEFEEFSEVIGLQVKPALGELAHDLGDFFKSSEGKGFGKSVGHVIAEGIKMAVGFGRELFHIAKVTVELFKGLGEAFTNGDLAIGLVSFLALAVKLVWDALVLLGKLILIGLFNALPTLLITAVEMLLQILKDALGPKISKMIGLDEGIAHTQRARAAAAKDTHDNTSAAFTRFSEDAREDVHQFAKKSGMGGAVDRANERINERERAAKEAAEAAERAKRELPSKLAAMKEQQRVQEYLNKRDSAMGLGSFAITLQQNSPTHQIMAS